MVLGLLIRRFSGWALNQVPLFFEVPRFFVESENQFTGFNALPVLRTILVVVRQDCCRLLPIIPNGFLDIERDREAGRPFPADPLQGIVGVGIVGGDISGIGIDGNEKRGMLNSGFGNDQLAGFKRFF
ncbi:MAG: hypothetical protein AAFP90_03600 [Planctomycetota bacterium]